MLNQGWNYSQGMLAVLSGSTFFASVSVLFSAPKVWKRRGKNKVQSYQYHWLAGTTIKLATLGTFGYFAFGMGEYQKNYQPVLPDIKTHQSSYQLFVAVLGAVCLLECVAAALFALHYRKYYLLVSNTMLLKSKLPEQEVERRRTKRIENNLAKKREEKGLVTVEEVSESDKDRTLAAQTRQVGTSWRAEPSYMQPGDVGTGSIKEQQAILEEDEDA